MADKLKPSNPLPWEVRVDPTDENGLTQEIWSTHPDHDCMIAVVFSKQNADYILDAIAQLAEKDKGIK